MNKLTKSSTNNHLANETESSQKRKTKIKKKSNQNLKYSNMCEYVYGRMSARERPTTTKKKLHNNRMEQKQKEQHTSLRTLSHMRLCAGLFCFACSLSRSLSLLCAFVRSFARFCCCFFFGSDDAPFLLRLLSSFVFYRCCWIIFLSVSFSLMCFYFRSYLANWRDLTGPIRLLWKTVYAERKKIHTFP